MPDLVPSWRLPGCQGLGGARLVCDASSTVLMVMPDLVVQVRDRCFSDVLGEW